MCVFFQAEDGIRDLVRSRGLGDVYKRQHKNHINLIAALNKIKKLGTEVNLVCTGNKTDFYSEVEKKITEFRLKDSIKFLGIVPEEDLIGLYKNSELVVIPTLYEAGSGPLYEAMRYKAVSYTHLRAHETVLDLVCRLLLEKKKNKKDKKKKTQIKQKITHTTRLTVQHVTRHTYEQISDHIQRV